MQMLAKSNEDTRELCIPTEVSSIDHNARLMLPFGFPVEIALRIRAIRTSEKAMMIRPREKIAPTPIFCLIEILRLIKRRIGSTPIKTSDATSMLVATQMALRAREV